jgi:glutaredoxin-like YruB-family protein
MPKVLIYTSPTCVWCQTAKSFLAEHDVSYLEIDVSQDTRKAEELVRKSGQTSLPVIEVDGEIVIGFDKRKLQKLLGLS